MSKAVFITIYGIIASKFFDIIPFGYLNDIGRGVIFDILELLWLWFGIYGFSSNEKKTKIKTHFIFLFYLLCLPSFYMSNKLFGQSYIQSIITSRALLLFLAIPAFIKINPKPKDIIRGCYYYSIIFIIVCLCRTFIPINFYVAGEKQISYMKASDDFLNRPIEICFGMILIPLYYYCWKLYHHFNFHDLNRIILLFIIVVAIQNRSILFPSAIFVILTLIFAKWDSRRLKYCFLIMIGICGTIISIDMFTKLIDETNSQLSSTGDPRIIAFAYFFDFSRMTWQEILFGTGNISFQTSSFVKDLQESHIHYSDVGFIGFWSVYGIFPSLLLLYYIVKGLFLRIPMYVKITALTILICSVTWCYFNSSCRITWFVLYFYLAYYYTVNITKSQFSTIGLTKT